eukprot:2037807-Rhodomonas_salina.2
MPGADAAWYGARDVKDIIDDNTLWESLPGSTPHRSAPLASHRSTPLLRQVCCGMRCVNLRVALLVHLATP